MTITTRVEHDLLGERTLPDNAYYGVHTLRALENFPVTGTPISQWSGLITALAMVKQAAADTNHRLGLLSDQHREAIVAACRQIAAGQWHQHFVVDMVQGGAGTSTNMNANEVIANVALGLLGQPRGAYQVLHPNEHVNLSQSTNDVYPTALRLATYRALDQLIAAMEQLKAACRRKAVEFEGDIKMGRTQLQDAVPMTLGQEFGAYAVMLGEDQERLREAALLMCEINLGATAIGTGINAPPDYAALVCTALREISGVPLSSSPDLIEATQDVGAFVHVSGVLKRVALKLSKICNDLRLLSSGPRSGFGEINLPAMQAGSSIMPGKVNPVIPEVVNQIAFEVLGNDVTVSFAAEAGQLQLNAFEPIIGYSLFKSISHLTTGCTVLATRCIDGITVNRRHLQRSVEISIGMVTALNPYIGYEAATSIAQLALSSGRGVIELVIEQGLMSEAELHQLMQPAQLTRPRPLPAAAIARR